MIKFSLKLHEIDKGFIIDGKNGAKYLPCVAFPVRDEHGNLTQDQYGNTHIIKQDLGKDQREQDKASNVMRPIVGNLNAIYLIEDVKESMCKGNAAPSEPVAARGSAPQSQQQDDFDPPF